MTNWRLMMLSGPLFAPATVPLVALASVVSVDMQQKEDGTHELVVQAPIGAAWLDYVQARRVIWVWVDGEVTEWLVARKSDALGNSEVTVHCDPLHRILVDFGTVEHLSAPGAVPTANLRGQNGTAENYLNTFVQAQLVRRDLDTWIGIGDIDFPAERFDLSFDNLTMWGVTVAVRDRVMGVARLRRDEYDRMYLIDVLETFTQAGVPEFWVVEGRNLLQLVREFSRESMRTAIRPVGEMGAGEEQRASIAFATHVVLAKTSNTLTLGRHGYEADATVGPIAQDGQFAPILADTGTYPGKYLEAMNGTRSAVVSSLAPQTVVVASGTAFAVGDDVFFVDDADGTGLTELAFPDGIQESGFVQGPKELPHYGHRNYVRNPAWRFWGGSGPTYFDRLPAGGAQITPKQIARVAGRIITTADADGTHTTTATLNIRGLTPGDVIVPGTVISAVAVGRNWVIGPAIGAVADGAGDATVTMIATWSLTDGQALTIHLPPFGEAEGYAVGYWTAASLADAGVLSQDIFVRYWPGLHVNEAGVEMNRLWVTADMVALASTPGIGGGWHATDGGEPRPPRLMLTNAAGTELVGTSPDNWSPSAEGVAREGVLSVSYDITADFTGKVRLRWPYLVAPGSVLSSPWVNFSFVQLHLGMDRGAALVEGSAATPLFYAGQFTGQLHSQWAATYSATSVELAAALGIPETSPALTLGSVIRLRSDSRNIMNVLLRVIGIRVSRESEARILTLGSAPEHFTDQVFGGVDKKRQFVFLDVEIEAPPLGTTLHVTQTGITSPTPRQDDGVGFKVRPGSVTAGTVPVERITPVEYDG